MQRLTGLDAAFLNLETPANHMHVMAVALLDPADAPGGFGPRVLRRLIESRLHLIPPFRRRLVEVPFGLYHPLWIEDPDFDLDYHVRALAAPAPGGPQELATIAGEIASWPLDRGRPLWQMWLVEGLEGGRCALVAKIHHAAIDGISGVEILAQLVDLEPKEIETPAEPEPWYPDRVPGEVEVVVGSLASIARQPLVTARALRNVTRSAIRVAQRFRHEPVPTGVPFTAPRLPWNGPITPHRQVAFASVSLDDVTTVKEAYDATVNDVVLALLAGGLRRYLDERGELPDKPLVAVVPVSVRSEEQRGTHGNRVSAMFTRLPTDLVEPEGRVDAVREVMSGAKLVHADIGGTTLEELVELAAPAVLAGVVRLYGQLRLAERHSPILNLVVSNVPGPQFPLYLGGARLESVYPMGPIVDGAGLNITVMSYRKRLDIGIMACRETVPEVWRLAGEMAPAMQELVATVKPSEVLEEPESLDLVTEEAVEAARAAVYPEME